MFNLYNRSRTFFQGSLDKKPDEHCQYFRDRNIPNAGLGLHPNNNHVITLATMDPIGLYSFEKFVRCTKRGENGISFIRNSDPVHEMLHNPTTGEVPFMHYHFMFKTRVTMLDIACMATLRSPYEERPCIEHNTIKRAIDYNLGPIKGNRI